MVGTGLYLDDIEQTLERLTPARRPISRTHSERVRHRSRRHDPDRFRGPGGHVSDCQASSVKLRHSRPARGELAGRRARAAMRRTRIDGIIQVLVSASFFIETA
jgi:hypothetical protein